MGKSHGLQYNTGPGGLMYAPARDFAYNYPQMIKCIIEAFNKDHWPALLGVLGEGLDEDYVWGQAIAAKDAYCAYLNKCCEDPSESLEQVLDRSGWNGVDELGQIAFLAMMGQVMTGQLFQGLRDITYEGEGARSEVTGLAQAGQAARRAMNGISEADERTQLEFELNEALLALETHGLPKGEIMGLVRKAL